MELCIPVSDPGEQLRNFRASHVYKRRDVAGICWEYIACGQGENVLLLRPGAHGFSEIIATLTQEDYLSRIKVNIDFDRNSTFTCKDLFHWPGSMLIIEADDDAYVSPGERAALRALYLQAQVHTFHGTSHFAWATEVKAFLDVIERFLQENP